MDLAYVVVLRSLDYVFRLGDKQRGDMLEAARRAMYNMHDACRSLASRGVDALFDMSVYKPVMSTKIASKVAGPTPRSERSAALAKAAATIDPLLRPQLERLAKSNRADDRMLADRLEKRLHEMTRLFVDAAGEG